ncbi:hypothetical protein T492DRAFT_350980 [Pavlovales sp. CCMP2436]|nr:hypothetical protein T492DRAFT_350980 [Pavlovales sp. CCMP2436]
MLIPARTSESEKKIVQKEPKAPHSDVFKRRSRHHGAPPPRRGSRRVERAALPSDVTGWCVSARDGSEPLRCSRRDGCTHAPGAAEYCTLVGGASDADSDGDASPPSAEPERGFPCGEAGREYLVTTASCHERHKRTHSSERPYACDEPDCEYRAAQASDLERHKRTHGGKRPYACDEPGCKYSNQYRCKPPQAAQAHALRRAALRVRRGRVQICGHYGEPHQASQAHAHRRAPVRMRPTWLRVQLC